MRKVRTKMRKRKQSRIREADNLKSKAYLLAALALVLGLAVVRAELPPDAYRSYQVASPEALTIKVKSVKIAKHRQASGMRSEIEAEAEVQAVKRSASGVRIGDVIRINYSHISYSQPMAGPSQPDIIREGASYPAFLMKTKNGAYTLAARGYSFRLSR